ncbi:MAG: L-ribulose-5-phosphate 4-epimerase [Bacteroidota bacterium]|nr:L-ribulose-5-phosphate 4-epimerase [Bacteroidota bacterium]
MLKKLREEVLEANINLYKSGLVIHTWGNVSGLDYENQLMVIKPSGLAYNEMTADDMVVMDFEERVIEGDLNPSSDSSTHLELYRNFPFIGGIVHTHSTNATAWAQAGLPIPAMGTTHADHFYGDVPCTRKLEPQEVKNDYELNTGKVIVETFKLLDEEAMPAVIVNDHGPFAWGKNAAGAVYNAIALEEIARMAILTYSLAGYDRVDQYLLDKHYTRKHGKDAYYGQKDKDKK